MALHEQQTKTDSDSETSFTREYDAVCGKSAERADLYCQQVVNHAVVGRGVRHLRALSNNWVGFVKLEPRSLADLDCSIAGTSFNSLTSSPLLTTNLDVVPYFLLEGLQGEHQGSLAEFQVPDDQSLAESRLDGFLQAVEGLRGDGLEDLIEEWLRLIWETGLSPAPGLAPDGAVMTLIHQLMKIDFDRATPWLDRVFQPSTASKFGNGSFQVAVATDVFNVITQRVPHYPTLVWFGKSLPAVADGLGEYRERIQGLAVIGLLIAAMAVAASNSKSDLAWLVFEGILGRCGGELGQEDLERLTATYRKRLAKFPELQAQVKDMREASSSTRTVILAAPL